MKTTVARQEHPDLIRELDEIKSMAPGKPRDSRAWNFVLLPENQRIGKRIAARWKSRIIADEDLNQVALLGLFAAVEHWRPGSSWGEWLTCAESWIGYHLQIEAARHRTVHVDDALLRVARTAQRLIRQGKTIAEVAALMDLSDAQAQELELVPLAGGRSELSPLVISRKSFRPNSEDHFVGALDAKRAGHSLTSIDNAGEIQSDLPQFADVLANRQPRKLTVNKSVTKFQKHERQLGFFPAPIEHKTPPARHFPN